MKRHAHAAMQAQEHSARVAIDLVMKTGVRGPEQAFRSVEKSGGDERIRTADLLSPICPFSSPGLVQ
jgi:hypothetical protein